MRPPIDVRRARITQPMLRPPGRAGDAAAYAQLARIVRRAPEVMVKVTGSTRDGGHPHVDLTVRALGSDGMRLNPRKADLEVWRQRFAQALRVRGVEAEASPRRARGVLLRAEPTPIRKLRERGEAGTTFEWQDRQRNTAKKDKAKQWETNQRDRRARVLRALSAEAVALARSNRSIDRAMGLALTEHLRRIVDGRPREERVPLSRLEHRRHKDR